MTKLKKRSSTESLGLSSPWDFKVYYGKTVSGVRVLILGVHPEQIQPVFNSDHGMTGWVGRVGPCRPTWPRPEADRVDNLQLVNVSARTSSRRLKTPSDKRLLLFLHSNYCNLFINNPFFFWLKIFILNLETNIRSVLNVVLRMVVIPTRTTEHGY